MSRDESRIRFGRRTLLKYAVTATGVAAVGATGVAGGAEATDAPETEWQRDYSGGPREYDVSLATVRQTADGGYVLAGSGAPITATGKEHRRLAVVKADADGAKQWLTFVDDGSDETTEVHCSDVVQTGDGGFAVVGYADNPAESVDDRVGGLVAVAAKVDADGETEWVTSLDAFEADEASTGAGVGHNDDASFEAVAPAGEDGGFVAGGDYEYDAWYVRFTADGDVAWDCRTDELGIDDVVEDGDGHLLFATVDGADVDEKRALFVDAEGEVRRRVDLGLDYAATPYNHEFVPTTDGGFAYTGRDRDREDMVLGKLDTNGEREWRREYDGPYGGGDWASCIVGTADGGYALAGYMSAAYSGDSTPTVLKADAEGVEQWRRLFSESTERDVRDMVETQDRGFAFLVHGNTLTKLVPDGSADVASETDETAGTLTRDATTGDSGPTTATGPESESSATPGQADEETTERDACEQ